MKKIGITGQNGFIGKHLYNTLGLYPEDFERVDFQKDYFEDSEKLNSFAAESARRVFETTTLCFSCILANRSFHL